MRTSVRLAVWIGVPVVWLVSGVVLTTRTLDGSQHPVTLGVYGLAVLATATAVLMAEVRARQMLAGLDDLRADLVRARRERTEVRAEVAELREAVTHLEAALGARRAVGRAKPSWYSPTTQLPEAAAESTGPIPVVNGTSAIAEDMATVTDLETRLKKRIDRGE